MATLSLPGIDGELGSYTTREPTIRPDPVLPYSRIAYAAAHIVVDPRVDHSPWLDAPIDWDATIAVRERLWDLGLGVAEAMDTAQRGMGLEWPVARELVARSLDAARAHGNGTALVACGCGTDHLEPGEVDGIDDVIAAYEEQMEAIEGLGGRLILMASRALATCARSPEDYARVYERLLGQARAPVILHWLGDMFDPKLTGYWGSRNLDEAMKSCLQVIGAHAHKVDGIKISLLDAAREVEMRELLPEGVRMYTGDDFHYPELIAGVGGRYSDALLGIFDAIAPVAAAALTALAQGDLSSYERLLAPTLPFARHVFQAPTRFYKTGIVFLAYLNGQQDHFAMLGGQQSARSILHLSQLFRLADAAGLLEDPDLAAARMRPVLEVHGVEA